MVPGRGFLLNNELTDFSTVYSAATPTGSSPASGRARRCRRPSCSRTAEPLLALGSPGGSTIITTVLQMLFNRIDRGMTIEQAIAAPRASQRNTASVTAEQSFIDAYGGLLARTATSSPPPVPRAPRPPRSVPRPRIEFGSTTATSSPPSPSPSAAVAAVRRAWWSRSQAQPYARQVFTEARLPSGLVLEYVDLGDPDGSPVVYQPGSPSTAGGGALLDEAARRHGVRLVSVCRPGYGASTSTPPGLASVGRQVVELADLLGLVDVRHLRLLGRRAVRPGDRGGRARPGDAGRGRGRAGLPAEEDDLAEASRSSPGSASSPTACCRSTRRVPGRDGGRPAAQRALLRRPPRRGGDLLRRPPPRPGPARRLRPRQPVLGRYVGHRPREP